MQQLTIGQRVMVKVGARGGVRVGYVHNVQPEAVLVKLLGRARPVWYSAARVIADNGTVL